MKFEKWQALGNDYVILEARALPWELTPARVRRICEPHTGLGSDGILLLAEPEQPGFVADLRIFNPDGSESGLSGNGSRQAALYLRRHGHTDQDRFSIRTRAGEIRVDIDSPTACTIDMGTARLRSEDYPDGSADGRGQARAGGRDWDFQHVNVGNPQCAIAVESEAELFELDLGAYGPGLERNRLFPNRTNVSWYTPLGGGRIRARIFERGVGETASSGTGATGAAVAHTLRGGSSPVSVVLDGGELQVRVGPELGIELAGWAVPVMSGTISTELIEELHASE